MVVIHHLQHVPRQDEVQQKIDAECSPYATFLLCTPTSIMPANDGGGGRNIAISKGFSLTTLNSISLLLFRQHER
jgi:hypothetical protein